VYNWLVHRWRQSLELRVVATTLCVSAIVVALLGLVVLDQVKHGLLDAKTRVALAETTAGVRAAQQELDAADRTDPNSQNGIFQKIVASRGGAALFDVVILPGAGTDNPRFPGW